VTGADLQVQEFILSRLAETPLVECELFAEEATPSVYKFKGTNGLVFLIDPKLPRDVSTITLSYTFFEMPGAGTPPTQAPAGKLETNMVGATRQTS
jgi:hypothetical protein